MNARTKEILKQAIHNYRSMQKADQQRLASSLKRQIAVSDHGIKHIGLGLDPDMVQAAKILLRIYKKL